MRYLVSGGAGFVGSHLVTRLLDQGHRVICVDDVSTGRWHNLAHLTHSPALTLIEQDICHVVLKEEVDAIFHLACPAAPCHYQRDPMGTTRTAVLGTLNLLQWAIPRRVPLLLASTSEVYGDPLVHPQVEGDWGHVNPIGPRACYDEGKRCAESLCMDANRQHGLPIKIARIFNTYGPRMQADDGRVIDEFIRHALQGSPLSVYGDGQQTRSFCYVDDLVEGLVRLMATPETVTGPVNLGNPDEIMIHQLAEQILALTGSSSLLRYVPLREDDPRRRQPDIRLAGKLLGWQPFVTLEDGLTRTAKSIADSMIGGGPFLPACVDVACPTATGAPAPGAGR